MAPTMATGQPIKMGPMGPAANNSRPGGSINRPATASGSSMYGKCYKFCISLHGLKLFLYIRCLLNKIEMENQKKVLYDTQDKNH